MTVPSATPFIERLEEMAAVQNLPLQALSVKRNGQFELNLKHSHEGRGDFAKTLLALRRLASIVAGEFGYKASFMAESRFLNWRVTACISYQFKRLSHGSNVLPRATEN